MAPPTPDSRRFQRHPCLSHQPLALPLLSEALLLIAVLAYGAWEWQQSPNGLIPAKALSSLGTGGDHGQDHDDGD